MIKILFVCLGNICRSPMAQFIFKDLVDKKGLSNKFYIDSSATSDENTYCKTGIYYGTKEILDKEGIPYFEHFAKQMTMDDYNNFDYIIGMEEKNIIDILEIVGNDPKHKVFRLLDFNENPRDIIDPWYSRNFALTFSDIKL